MQASAGTARAHPERRTLEEIDGYLESERTPWSRGEWAACRVREVSMAATVVREWTEHCRCKHGCPTHARITKWSCGCVEVTIYRDRLSGRDCTDFSGMRRSCGKPGRPGA